MKYCLIILIVTFPCIIHAQDSSNTLSQQFEQQYNFFSKDVLSQPLFKLKNYAIVEAGYNSKGGKYILSQDAEKQHDIFFSTQGTKQLKGFLLSGAFAYARTLKDSVGYTMRNDLYSAAPYYYYAAKKGNWEVSTYDLQGIVSRNLNKKITVGLGAAYQSSIAWRGNDPRSEYFMFNMAVDGTVQYKIAKNHTVGITGGAVFKSNETNIEYRNKDYGTSLMYPEYVTHLQFGYGFDDYRQNAWLKTGSNGWKAGLLYNGHLSLGTVTAKANYTRLSSKFTGPSSVYEPEGVYGWFHENIWTGNLWWQKETVKGIFSFQANYLNHKGKDQNVFLNASNYVYSYEQVKLKPVFGRYKNQQLVHELGADISLTNSLKVDGNADQRAAYQYLNTGIFGAYYFPVNNHKNTFKALVGIDVQTPLSSTAHQSVQLHEFAQAVIYRDYYFYSAFNYSGKVELLYSFKLKETACFVKLNGQYQQANIKADATLPALNKPGNSRWNYLLSVGVTL